MKFQIRNVRKFIAKFVGIMLGNWDGQSTWRQRSILKMKREWKKLRKNNVGNVDAGECLSYIGEKMLLAMYAWDIGKVGQRRMRKKLGSWIRNTGMNIGRRKRRITRNIACWKLNVKCVSVELGNLIGQDIWQVGSICWGAVVEKLMMMWGVGEDDTKGRVRHITTLMHDPVAPFYSRKLNSRTSCKIDGAGSKLDSFSVCRLNLQHCLQSTAPSKTSKRFSEKQGHLAGPNLQQIADPHGMPHGNRKVGRHLA